MTETDAKMESVERTAAPTGAEPDSLTPEARAAWNALHELEDRQAEMRRRAKAEADALEGMDAVIEAAEGSLSSAEAAEIVSPGEDATEAANAARARLEDLQTARTKHARASEVLEAEADKLDAEVDQARKAAFDVIASELVQDLKDAKAEGEKLVEQLRAVFVREAHAHRTLSALQGATGGRFRIGELEQALVALRAKRGLLSDPEPARLATLRPFAAYCAPSVETIPHGWVGEDHRARFSARVSDFHEAKERERQRRVERAERAQRDYIDGAEARSAERRRKITEARRREIEEIEQRAQGHAS